MRTSSSRAAVRARGFVAAGGGVPLPAFTVLPSISPSGGAVGQTFTAANGAASNATGYTRRWLLGTTAIGTGTTVTPNAAGALTLEVTATGPGGAKVATSTAVTVTDALVVPAEFNGLTDDMSGTSLLTARSNWTVNDPAFNSFWKIENGYMHLTQRDRSINTVLFGGVTSDFDVSFDHDFTGMAPDPSGNGHVEDDQQFVFWWQDDNNYCYVKMSSSEARFIPTNRIRIFAVSGGNETLIASTSNRFGAYNSGTVRYRLVCNGGNLRLSTSGKWNEGTGLYSKFPFDAFMLADTVPAAKRSGRFGVRARVNSYPLLRNVTYQALDCTIERIPPFIPRDSRFATGASALPISGNYGGSATPQQWVYRLLDYNNQATVLKDWATLSDVTAANGAWSAKAVIPTGGPYTVQAGFIGNDGLLHSDLSRRLLAGGFGLVYGQSNSVGRRATQDQNNLIVRGDKAAGWAYNSIGLGARGMPIDEWAVADSSLTYTPATVASAKILSEYLNVPFGVGAAGIGGVGISVLVPPNGQPDVGAGWYSFTDALSQLHGIPDFVVWHQGENNINGAPGTTDSTDFYAKQFKEQLLPGLRSVTGNPNLKVFIIPIGNNPDLGGGGGESAATIARCQEHFPLLKLEYEKCVAGSGHMYSDPNVHYAASMVGIVHDDVHYSPTGYAESERRWVWSVMKHVYGLNVHDGRGPVITSAAKTSATTVELTLDLNGATALAGTGSLTGYLASVDNFATSIAGTWARSGSKIVFTASAALPSGTLKVDSFRDAKYNDSNVATGTYSDTAPIPVWPIMTPLVVI